MKTIFIVDDNQTNLVAAQQALAGIYKTLQMTSANRMFALLERVSPDLILLDVDMPEMDGFEAMERLQGNDKYKSIPVIFLTASNDEQTEVHGFELGAVDFIPKPFSKPILLKRIESHINIDAIVKQRTAEIEASRENMNKLKNGIIAIMADMVEGRDELTGGHIDRTQTYLKILVEGTMKAGVYADEIAAWDLELVLPSAQLHDIGKITISDIVLNKLGKLTDEEFAIMKTHAGEGEKLIDKITEQVGVENAEFMQHAKLFAGTHHEKWDGTGYPRGLSGLSIPLQGRLMAIADVYDALTSSRVYKAAYTHDKAVEIIKEGGGTHFDQRLVDVFLAPEVIAKMKDTAKQLSGGKA